MIFAISRCKALNAAYFAKQNSRVRKAYGRLLAAHSRLADEITEVKTICQTCGKHASFNKRALQNTTGSVIDPGWDKFVASCYKHYRE